MDVVDFSSRYDPRVAHFFSKAAEMCVAPVPGEVVEFCHRLSQLRGHRRSEIWSQISDLTIPTGYMHCRVYDADDMMEFCGGFSGKSEPLDVWWIAMMVVGHEKFLNGRWVRTTPLPDRDPGVLDLMIHFEPRDHPLQEEDVDC